MARAFTFSIALIFSIGAFARNELTFTEVNSQNSNTEFRQYVVAAIQRLHDLRHIIAHETLRSIELGYVQIDEIPDMLESDYKMLLKDYGGTIVDWQGRKLKAKDYPRLAERDPEALSILEEVIDGYMLGTHIYVTANQSTWNLALSLAHEVNHVVNRSDERYGESDVAGFKEEFRAFYVEAILSGKDVTTPAVCRDIKKFVADSYEFQVPDLDVIPCRPRGELVPNQAAWNRRGPGSRSTTGIQGHRL